MPTRYISPSAKQQFFDLNGDPAVGYLLYTYVTGSSTPATTYTDATGGSANTNPIELDSRGEADVWLIGGTIYRYILKTAAGVQIWSVDGIESGSTDNFIVRGDLTVSGDIDGGFEWLEPLAVDQSTTLTTGTAKATFRLPACTVLEVRGALVTASSSGNVVLDINEGGTSILGQKITIEANETSSLTATTQPTITDATIADDAIITIDIDSAGTGAKGWIVGMKVRWTV